MQVFSHNNADHKQQLSVFTDESPFQFLPAFTLFNQDYFKSNLSIFFSENSQSYMPIKVWGNSILKFGQIQHAPIKNNIELNAEEQAAFYNELISFCKSNNIVGRFIQPHPYSILKSIPAQSKYCNFGTYIVDLQNQTEEEILNRFKKNYITEVKQTESRGAVCKFGFEYLNDFYACYKNTMLKVRKSVDDIEYFKSLYQYFGDSNITVGVVYENENPIGSMFVMHTKYTALYTHAGTMGETKLSGRMKYLIWECMKRLKKNGVKKFDFVGVRINSKDESLQGIFNFKKGFGGDLKEGFLWKMDLNPLKAKIYDLTLKVRKPSETFKDIIDQENGN